MIAPRCSPGPAPGTAAGHAPPFGGTEFIVVDVETTGWEPETARITEIAAVRVTGRGPRAVFSALVNPGCPIPEPVTVLTGITDALVADAPPIADVLPGFLAFAAGGVLTAHNAPFDVGFLSAACHECELPWPAFTILDTVAVARVALDAGEVPDCKLSTLARHFAAAVLPCHRALADALATADVLTGLLARLAAAGVGSLPEVSRLIADRAAAEAAARTQDAAPPAQDAAAQPGAGAPAQPAAEAVGG
jgi:DNA polymerase III subunit epsilon